MEDNGWIINATAPDFQYVHQCGKETWFGWNSGGSVGAISAVLKGSGESTLAFGNCWTRGYVRAYLNDQLIGSAGGRQSANVTFSFSTGDVLTVAEYNVAIIKLYELSFDCNGKNDIS